MLSRTMRSETPVDCSGVRWSSGSRTGTPGEMAKLSFGDNARQEGFGEQVASHMRVLAMTPK